MKRTLSVVLVCALVLTSLSGCGSKRESAQAVVESAIKSVQTLDFEAMRGYWGDTEVDSTNTNEEDAQSIEIMKAVVASLTYNVKNSEENEKAGTATVTVEFTNTDMGQVMSAFISEMFSIAMEYAFLPEDQQPSEDELDAMYMEKFTELLNREENTTVTESVDIELTLKDDKWVITPTEGAINAMFGGMFDIANAFGDSASTNSELDKISEIRNWVVSDIWNTGICDMSFYYSTGMSSTGSTMDPEFTIQQLTKAMELKPEYDAFMASLSSDYAELSGLWVNVSEQIDVLYNQILENGSESSGQQLDTGLYDQYFNAFDDAYFEIS